MISSRVSQHTAAAALAVMVLAGPLLTPRSAGASTVAKPAAPTNVTAVPGSHFVSVRWTPPANAEAVHVTRYVVRAKPSNRICVTESDARACSMWELTNGTAYTFTVTAHNASGYGVTSARTTAVTPLATRTTVPYCSDYVIYPTRAVPADVRAVVTAYYVQKNLAPIKIINNRETILNVHEQSVGVHHCVNPGGGLSGYVGAVPVRASAAVRVVVLHKPYPVVGSTQHFVTLAKLAAGWRVVAEGTGP